MLFRSRQSVMMFLGNAAMGLSGAIQTFCIGSALFYALAWGLSLNVRSIPVTATVLGLGTAAVIAIYWLSFGGSTGPAPAFVFGLLRLRSEEQRSADLLRLMLPGPTIAQLAANPVLPLAERHEDATVLFADISGFTPLASSLEPEVLLGFLHDLFVRFDEICDSEELEKVKTIGDAYMAVAGVPIGASDHAARAARAAVRMRAEAESAFAAVSETFGASELGIRIGLNSGPVVAGVLSRSKVAFDLWGDTVNIASRMESHGEVGEIQMTAGTASLLPDSLPVRLRGTVEVKGRGPMET